MNISFELYKIFYLVAKNASFSRAAQELCVSQSAVSQSVKTLEQRLGFPLFIRTTKSVSLTIDGELLYQHVEQAFAIISSAESKLRNHQDPFQGELVIASTDTLCKYFLLPKIKELQKDFPKIKIKIINGTSLECLRILKNAKVDFAIVNLPTDLEKKNFNVEKSYCFNDVFVASSNSDFAKNMPLASIARHPLLVLDHKSVTRQFLDSIFLKKGIVIQPEIELQNIDIILEMTKIGLGISFVPDMCVTSTSFKIINTREKIPKRKYGIISLKELPLIPVAQTFIEKL